MSGILQVANIHFDQNGNNQIVYDNGAVKFLMSNNDVLSNNNIALYKTSLENCISPIGKYTVSISSNPPIDHIAVTNTAYSKDNYPQLYNLLNIAPHTDYELGVSWTNRTSGVSNTLTSVTYGNGVYAAVGSRVILNSTNGTTWNNFISAAIANTNFKGVTYGNGLFVAVGFDTSAYGSRIMTSTDATTWSNSTTTFNNTFLNGVVYGNNTYVAAGGNSTTAFIVSSTDGANWTSRSPATVETSNTSIPSGFRRWTNTSPISNSTNNILPYFNSVTYGNGLFVAVGYGNILHPALIQFSTDAITWSSLNRSIVNEFVSVNYGGEYFLATGLRSIYSSTLGSESYSVEFGTGTKYYEASLPSFTNTYSSVIYGSSYGDGVYTAIGENGAIFKSTDAQSWAYVISANTANNNDLRGITYGNSKFVVVGTNGSIQTSNTVTNAYSYDTSTQFKTPPYLDYFYSPTQDELGANVYIYMKYI